MGNPFLTGFPLRWNGKVFSRNDLFSLTTGYEAEIARWIITLTDDSPEPIPFQTSGTTGTPKTLYFTREAIWKSAAATCSFFGLSEESTLLACLPVAFVAGRLQIARALVCGGKLRTCQPATEPDWQGPVDFCALTPAMAFAIHDTERFQQIDQLILGGGEISPVLENALKKSGKSVWATYGMTETLTHIALRQISPVFRETYQIIHPDIRIDTNEAGCLRIHYPGSVLETHDMVALTGPGEFIWKGRMDAVINSGGVKIHPEEVEQKLRMALEMPESGWYIAGKKDEKWGEKLVLAALHPENLPELDQLNQHLNSTQKIKEIIDIQDIEYTSTGKIRRQKY